jgi:hypothetical protein
MGVPAGTLASLRWGRVKAVRAWVEAAVRRFAVNQLEAEIRRLTHELDLVRQVSSRPDDDAIFAAQAALDTARRLINGVGTNGKGKNIGDQH